MRFEELVKKRISTRKFQDKKVEREQLEKILEAGRVAPTAKNLQPQKIYVIESEEGIKKVDMVSPCRYGAKTCLLICGDKNIAWNDGVYSSYEMDTCIVATHMMLQAADLGVDSIWVRMLDIEKSKELFELPDGVIPICLMPLGYRIDTYKASPLHSSRKPIEETVKYI